MALGPSLHTELIYRNTASFQKLLTLYYHFTFRSCHFTLMISAFFMRLRFSHLLEEFLLLPVLSPKDSSPSQIHVHSPSRYTVDDRCCLVMIRTGDKTNMTSSIMYPCCPSLYLRGQIRCLNLFI